MMATFEVTYQEGEEMKSELVEATSPVEASRLFMQANQERSVVVICVVRQ